MPSLSSMRELDQQPLPPLGERLPRPSEVAAQPAPKPLEHNPNVLVNQDGKMETKIPGNGAAIFGGTVDEFSKMYLNDLDEAIGAVRAMTVPREKALTAPTQTFRRGDVVRILNVNGVGWGMKRMRDMVGTETTMRDETHCAEGWAWRAENLLLIRRGA